MKAIKQIKGYPKVVKDLGYIFANVKSEKKRRFVILECPICGNNFRSGAYDYSIKRITKCKSCASRIGATKHGKSRHRAFKIIAGIRQRCENKNDTHYDIYGGRGIAVCDEWKRSSLAFYEWAISNGYSDNLTIDRINNDGNYEPSNCRWVDKTVQAQNTGMYSTNKTGYRGITKRPDNGRYRVKITVRLKQIHLGHTDDPAVGALIYNGYVVENKTEHYLNKIDESRISELRADGFPVEDYTPKGEQYKIYFIPAQFLKKYHSEKVSA